MSILEFNPHFPRLLWKLEPPCHPFSCCCAVIACVISSPNRTFHNRKSMPLSICSELSQFSTSEWSLISLHEQICCDLLRGSPAGKGLAPANSISMVSRPRSPTSLLWAHELKRQHEHLLQRQKGLEAKNEDFQAAVTRVQARAEAVEDHAVVASTQLSAATATIQAQATQVESLTKRVLALEADRKKMNEDMDKSFGREKIAFTRINDLEASQEGISKSLQEFAYKLDDLRAVEMEAKILEMGVINGKHEGQLRNFGKVISEGRSSHEGLVCSVSQLQMEVNALKARVARGRPDQPLSFTVWTDTSNVRDGSSPEGKWSPIEEQRSRQMTLEALELSAKPGPWKWQPNMQTPQFLDQRSTSSDRFTSPSPLARKHSSLPRQVLDTEKTQGRRKRQARDTQHRHGQPRRSARIASKPILFHDLDEAILNQTKTHRTMTSSSRPARKSHTTKQITPKSRADKQSGNQSLKSRLALIEDSTAGNRGSSGRLPLSRTAISPKTRHLEVNGLAQEQVSTTQQSPLKNELQVPLLNPPCTPSRSPEVQEEVLGRKQDPKTPQRLAVSGPGPSIDESPPWRAPSFMLPDFFVPPDWYRPGEP